MATKEVANSLWIGEKLLPQNIISIKSFLQNGFDYNLYVYDDVKNIPLGVNVLDANDILPESRIWVYKKGFNKGGVSGYSCEFRYQFLYNRGGLFVDTDIVLLKQFDLDKSFIFISELNESGEKSVTNGLIYSRQPACKIFSTALDDISYRNKARLRHGEVGPILLNNLVNKYNLEKYVLLPYTFCSVGWFEPLKLIDGSQLSEDAIGIHLCGAIEQLKRKYL